MFSENLKYLRKEHHLSQDKLAEKLNEKYDTHVSKSMISRWERGSTDPQMKYVRMIADFFDLSPDLVDSDASNSNDQIILSVYKKLTLDRKRKVVKFANEQLDEQNSPVSLNEKNIVYLYGAVSAGTGEYAPEESNPEMIEVRGKIPKYDYAVRVNGDSMEPTFIDGQILFVNKNNNKEDVRNGQFVIADLNGNMFVKKIVIDKNNVRLVSLNKKYKDIIIHDYDDFMIQGTVIV